jgi:siroheme synthase (precorrin-2 oxidase/ferrochelatase)
MMSLGGKQAIVVGGGRVGMRKILGLLESEAQVIVISPKLEQELQVRLPACLAASSPGFSALRSSSR